MSLREWAVFRADDFPDDTIEDGLDILQFPGRNIAEALCEILAGVGCTDIGTPSHEGEHGWGVHFKSAGRPFFCQVSRIEPETLLLFAKNYGSEGLFYRGPSRHAELLERVRPAVEQDPRFRELTWYTRREMDTVDWNLSVEEPADDQGS